LYLLVAITSASFRTNHPVLQEFKEQQQNLIDLLDQQTQQLLDQISIPVDRNSPALEYQDPTRLNQIQQLVDTTNQIEELRSRYQSLTASKEKVAEQAEQFPEIASQYREVEEQIGLTNQIVNRLKSQREILRLEISQNKMPWELLSEPQINRDVDGNPEATASNSKIQLLVGVIGGMFLGSIAALLIEKRQDIFYESEDIPDKVSVPLLETIPFIGEKSNNSYPKRSLSFVNAIESLYTKLSLTYTTPSIQSLVVTSVEPNKNQSIIAFNLAQVAAAMGNKVILIDADFQDSELRNPLKLTDQQESEHSLRKFSDSGELIQSSQVDNLSVLTLGISLRKTGKRLWSNQIKQLIKTWQEKYDLVIYNGPPLSQSVDIHFLAAHTDGIMLVSEIKKSKCSVVKKSIEQLNDYNLNLLGVVAIEQSLNQNLSEQDRIDDFNNTYNSDLHNKS
jgi:capsular exopolysaccharide synthesis family protein